jgi:hypothetical protein
VRCEVLALLRSEDVSLLLFLLQIDFKPKRKKRMRGAGKERKLK